MNLRTADGLAARGDVAGARAMYEQLLPSQRGAYERFCHATAMLDRHEEAMSCCHDALRLAPDNAFLLKLDGQEALLVGRVERALASYQRASRLDPTDGELKLNLGIALNAAALPTEASEQLRGAVRLQPQSVAAYTEFGRALDATGSLLAAIDAYTTASALDPIAIGPRVDLGNAMLNARRPSEAADAFERALRAAPALDAAHSVAYFGLGRAALALQDGCGSLNAFSSATALAPHDSDLWHQRGVAARRCSSQREAEAKHAWRQAVRLSPRRTDSLTLLRLAHSEGWRSMPSSTSSSSSSSVPHPGSPAACLADISVTAAPPPPTRLVEGDNEDDTAAAGGADWSAHAHDVLRRHGALLLVDAVPAAVADTLGVWLRREASRGGDETARSKTKGKKREKKGTTWPTLETTNTTLAREGRRHLAVSLRTAPVSDALAAVARVLHPILCLALGRQTDGEGGTCSATAALRVLESGVLTSSPGALAQPIHADTAGEEGEGRTYKIQLATSLVTAAMGPIEVVPGSMDAPPSHAEGAPLVPIAPMPPGAVFIYDTRLWHRGGANRSDRDRPIYYVTLIDGSSLPPAGLPYTIEPPEIGCFELRAEGLHLSEQQANSKAMRRCTVTKTNAGTGAGGGPGA